MKYCKNCGAELMDEAVICPNCGTSVEEPAPKNNKLLVAALVFMCLTLVWALIQFVTGLIGIQATIAGYVEAGITQQAAQSLAYAALVLNIIPLAWGIPMTISVGRKIKNDAPITTAFKVCTLIFVNLIAGILLLCRKED